ncbi:hypothetical protein [Polaribacter marinivivus]|uniref:Peptidase M48 domain-containing protein n=1 Tax=Polaribacter marinivivus TaxID=1524260 RepID=A0ABV8R5T8_9FLAO
MEEYHYNLKLASRIANQLSIISPRNSNYENLKKIDVAKNIFKNYGNIGGLDHPIQKMIITNFLDLRLSYYYVRFSKMPNVYYYFIENNSFKIMVKKYDNDYFIGIFSGVFYIIQDLIFKVNSNTVDSKLSITNFRNNISFDQKDESNLFKNNNALFHENIPLFQVIFQTIFTHELCHIIRGHLDLKENEKLSRSELQTLEMDADSFSVNYFFIFNIEHQIINKETSFLKLSKKNIETLENYLFYTYIFLRFQNLNKFEINKTPNLRHPPTIIRLKFIIDNILSILELKVLEKEKLLHFASNNIPQIIKKAEETYLKITYDSEKLINFIELFDSKEFDEYKIKIFSNWNKLRDKLVNYSISDLPEKNNF